jgi:hypothetical protein
MGKKDKKEKKSQKTKHKKRNRSLTPPPSPPKLKRNSGPRARGSNCKTMIGKGSPQKWCLGCGSSKSCFCGQYFNQDAWTAWIEQEMFLQVSKENLCRADSTMQKWITGQKMVVDWLQQQFPHLLPSQMPVVPVLSQVAVPVTNNSPKVQAMQVQTPRTSPSQTSPSRTPQTEVLTRQLKSPPKLQTTSQEVSVSQTTQLELPSTVPVSFQQSMEQPAAIGATTDDVMNALVTFSRAEPDAVAMISQFLETEENITEEKVARMFDCM